MRLGWVVVLASVLLVLASAISDKQLSYNTDFSWRTFSAEKINLIGWQVTQSHRDDLPKGTLLTHLRMGDTWQPLNSYVLSPALDFVSNTQGLLRILQIEQTLYAMRHQPIKFKTHQGKIITAYYQPATWSQLKLSFWVNKLIFLCGVLFALWALFFAHKQTALASAKQHIRVSQQAVMLNVCMLLAIGLATTLSVERTWAMPATYLWGRFLLSITLVSIFEIMALRLILLQPNPLLRKYRIWRYIYWGWLLVQVSHLLLLAMQHRIAIEFTQQMFSVFPWFYLAAFVHQFIYAYIKGSHLVDKLSIRTVLIFNLLLIALLLGTDFLLKQFYLNSGVNPDTLNLITALLLTSSLLVLVFRYQLYRLLHWWWILYACLAGAITLIATLTWLSDWGKQYQTQDLILSFSLSLSVALSVGFGFLSRRFKGNIQTLYHSSELLQSIKQLPEGSDEFWHSQQNLFMQALDIKQASLIEVKQAGIRIIQGGEAMQIHILDNMGLRLSAPDKGRRLFNEQDSKTLALLHDLSLQQVREKHAFSQGEQQTRQQVAYDLHDDIGGRLHQLAHGDGKNTAKYAQQTLEQLRTLTHALHKKQQNIDAFFSDIRHELQRHGEACNVRMQMHIQLSESIQNSLLNPMSIMQLRAIISELTRNALQHDKVSCIEMKIQADAQQVRLSLSNDGAPTNVSAWVSGVGTVSIKRRVHQMDGEINWQANTDGGVTARLNFKTTKWLALR